MNAGGQCSIIIIIIISLQGLGLPRPRRHRIFVRPVVRCRGDDTAMYRTAHDDRGRPASVDEHVSCKQGGLHVVMRLAAARRFGGETVGVIAVRSDVQGSGRRPDVQFSGRCVRLDGRLCSVRDREPFVSARRVRGVRVSAARRSRPEVDVSREFVGSQRVRLVADDAVDGWMEGDITIPFEFCKTLTDSPGLTNAAMLVDVKNNRIIINDAAPSNTVLTNRGFELKRTTTWTAMMDARPDEEGSILCKNVSLMLDVNLTTTCIVLQAFFGLVSDRMMQGKNVIIRNFANLHGEKKKRKYGTIVYKPKCEISDTFGKGEDPKSKNHRSDLAKCCSPGSALWRQDHDS